VTALFALLSAVLVGGADFLGGFVSRRAPSTVVVAAGQLLGLLVGIPLALAWGSDGLALGDVLLSLASGLGIGVGLLCFYAAMAAGVVSLVAPITAVTGAVIPVGVGLARGERPEAVALTGIVLALAAVTVVSLAPDDRAATGQRSMEPRVLALALAAGVAFGAFYVLFAEINEDAGMWPVPIQRVASSALLLALVAWTGASLRAARPIAHYAAGIAVLEVVATMFVLLAVQRGPLAVASVLASLYPVTTVLLAGIVLRERLTRVQMAAVALALVAVALVSAP
jgi:drug/metabolite transporter (DMT)-like permease